MLIPLLHSQLLPSPEASPEIQGPETSAGNLQDIILDGKGQSFKRWLFIPSPPWKELGGVHQWGMAGTRINGRTSYVL
jgi:hypothetical protein